MLVLPEELDVDEGPEPDVEPVSLAVEVASDVVEVGMSDWLVELDYRVGGYRVEKPTCADLALPRSRGGP